VLPLVRNGAREHQHAMGTEGNSEPAVRGEQPEASNMYATSLIYNMYA
jgi:hypothetical protein